MRPFSGISWRIFHISWRMSHKVRRRREAENGKKGSSDVTPHLIHSTNQQTCVRSILCERTDSLRALDSVAGYLENGHFHPINDKEPIARLLSLCYLLFLR